MKFKELKKHIMHNQEDNTTEGYTEGRINVQGDSSTLITRTWGETSLTEESTTEERLGNKRLQGQRRGNTKRTEANLPEELVHKQHRDRDSKDFQDESQKSSCPTSEPLTKWMLNCQQHIEQNAYTMEPLKRSVEEHEINQTVLMNSTRQLTLKAIKNVEEM
jgi:hypothetical protein